MKIKLNERFEISKWLFFCVVIISLLSIVVIGKMGYDSHKDKILDQGKTEGYAQCKADIFSELTLRGYVQIGTGDQVYTLIPYIGE